MEHLPTFQRIMNEVVQDLDKFAHAYLDDLVVFSDTWTEHLSHLETILEKLQEFGLTAKMPKCQWAMAECTYLGRVMGGGQVKSEINKLERCEKLSNTKNKEGGPVFLRAHRILQATSLRIMLP